MKIVLSFVYLNSLVFAATSFYLNLRMLPTDDGVEQLIVGLSLLCLVFSWMDWTIRSILDQKSPFLSCFMLFGTLFTISIFPTTIPTNVLFFVSLLIVAWRIFVNVKYLLDDKNYLLLLTTTSTFFATVLAAKEIVILYILRSGISPLNEIYNLVGTSSSDNTTTNSLAVFSALYNAPTLAMNGTDFYSHYHMFLPFISGKISYLFGLPPLQFFATLIGFILLPTFVYGITYIGLLTINWRSISLNKNQSYICSAIISIVPILIYWQVCLDKSNALMRSPTGSSSLAISYLFFISFYPIFDHLKKAPLVKYLAFTTVMVFSALLVLSSKISTGVIILSSFGFILLIQMVFQKEVTQKPIKILSAFIIVSIALAAFAVFEQTRVVLYWPFGSTQHTSGFRLGFMPNLTKSNLSQFAIVISLLLLSIGFIVKRLWEPTPATYIVFCSIFLSVLIYVIVFLPAGNSYYFYMFGIFLSLSLTIPILLIGCQKIRLSSNHAVLCILFVGLSAPTIILLSEKLSRFGSISNAKYMNQAVTRYLLIHGAKYGMVPYNIEKRSRFINHRYGLTKIEKDFYQQLKNKSYAHKTKLLLEEQGFRPNDKNTILIFDPKNSVLENQNKNQMLSAMHISSYLGFPLLRGICSNDLCRRFVKSWFMLRSYNESAVNDPAAFSIEAVCQQSKAYGFKNTILLEDTGIKQICS